MSHPDWNDPDADFSLSNHGSILLLGANTQEAAEWVDENFPPEAQRWCGMLVVEPRYVEALCAAIEYQGMTID